MVEPTYSTNAYDWLEHWRVFPEIVTVVGVALFFYFVARRLMPLLSAASDPRFDHPWTRSLRTLKYWLVQWKQPRFLFAGILHVVIFAGFLVLSVRSLSLVLIGFFNSPALVDFSGPVGHVYSVTKNYTSTLVLVAVLIAGIRRGFFKPVRYAVPKRYGKDHTFEAMLILGLISLLLISESLFEASSDLISMKQSQMIAATPILTLSWIFSTALISSSHSVLTNVRLCSYLIHELTFFSFLCLLPMGKHFHVVTSVFNVYFARLTKGTIKPVRWGTSNLDDMKSFGVKRLSDFTWKHLLDFYSCADCGRCSDSCPANSVGRPLSPRFLTIKGRDYVFQRFPFFSSLKPNSELLVGSIYTDDEIWSCTTCGACEEECPLMIEYIDKIVDLRRGLIDEGNVPQSLQKPLRALESRGNPYGKMEKKRAEWTSDLSDCAVKGLDGTSSADTLYFVDSITSYDDRIQRIARSTARILSDANVDFGILGTLEKDSGHDVRRFGEEMLFVSLRDRNTEVIQNAELSASSPLIRMLITL